MSSSYRVFALIPPHVDLSLAGVAERLSSRFEQVTGSMVRLVEHDAQLDLMVDQWSLHLALATEPHVLAESKEVAEMFAKERPDRGIIAACDRRIEVWSEPDPEMVYFNSYIGVLETLEAVPGVILLDPESGTFI